MTGCKAMFLSQLKFNHSVSPPPLFNLIFIIQTDFPLAQFSEYFILCHFYLFLFISTNTLPTTDLFVLSSSSGHGHYTAFGWGRVDLALMLVERS